MALVFDTLRRVSSWLRRRPVRAIGVALVGAAMLCAGCGPERRGRVFVIGIDGATMRLAQPLIDAGQLPNLARIAAEGASGPLRSQLPLLSPRVWNTIATGKSPEAHGVTSFAREGADGVRRLLSSHDRRVHALWNIASDAGLSVAVIGWWNTYPPEKIRGVMASDHLIAEDIAGRENITRAISDASGPRVHPETWEPRLVSILESPEPAVEFPDPFAGNTELPKWVNASRLSMYFENDAVLTRMAVEIDRELRPDLLMVLLTGVDRVSHVLWGTLESPDAYPAFLRPSPQGRAAGAAALRSYYAYTDALIGRILELAGPGDLVLVLSDHGFAAGHALKTITGMHETEEAVDGVLFARGPGIEPGASTQGTSILDVTPTILTWLGIPAGRDMEGRVATFLDRTPPEPIDTHDVGPVERLGTAPSGADEVLLERLRALGYFE